MGTDTHQFKFTVAAFLLAVGYSLPLAAQEADVDALLDRLAEAEPGEDRRIVSQIFLEWSKSGSPAIDLLLQRGQDALEAGEFDAAIEHFTAAIDHDPTFAEAYHGRATAYYMTQRIGPSLDDLRQALVLNPRHFRAMQGFAVILEELDRPEDALDVLREVRRIHPADAQVADAVERLELQLGGRTL